MDLNPILLVWTSINSKWECISQALWKNVEGIFLVDRQWSTVTPRQGQLKWDCVVAAMTWALLSESCDLYSGLYSEPFSGGSVEEN